MKKYLPLIILFLFTFLIGLATYKINSKQEIPLTKTTLENFKLADLFKENEFFTKESLAKKYSLINFFASWCTTCRAEHEALMRLNDEKIIAIYGVAFRDIDSNTKDFLSKYGNPYDLTSKDPQGIFSKSVNVNAIPETLLIDPEGNIVKRYQGNLQENMIREIKILIKSY